MINKRDGVADLVLTPKIRCRCNAEFCYVCGLRWKTCNCPGQTLHSLTQQFQGLGPEREARNLELVRNQQARRQPVNYQTTPDKCSHDGERLDVAGGSSGCESCSIGYLWLKRCSSCGYTRCADCLPVATEGNGEQK